MEGSITSLLAVVAAAILLAAFLTRSSRLRSYPLPPGPPKTGWLSGHLSILPLVKQGEVYAGWARKYGSVIQMRAYHQRMVVLNSVEDCVELFEKRSSLYADRPSVPMIDLMGWDFNSAVMPYSQRWRRQRRLFQQMFRKTTSLSYRPEQTRKVNDMLYGLVTSPQDFRDHVQTVAAAIVMSATYGYDLQPKKDYFIEIAEDATIRASLAVVPGARLVNALPILKYIPSWLPGAEFQKVATETKELTDKLKEMPFKFVEETLKAGGGTNCIVAQKLPSCKTEEDISTLQDFAAMAYAAGADTTAATLQTFFFAMASGASPDAQRKAQEEIDRVVGRDRLPTFEDWDSLPYTEAILREVLRWKPTFPIGVPHKVIDDDIYKGYFIPKGTLIFMNIWALSRDERTYKDPDTFNPDRFIDEDGNLTADDCSFVFGFGRRKCPGVHMARATVWLAMATTLWAFNIGKAKDASGNEIPISGEFCDGMISHPQPHACSIALRHPEVERIIKEAAANTKDRMQDHDKFASELTCRKPQDARVY